MSEGELLSPGVQYTKGEGAFCGVNGALYLYNPLLYLDLAYLPFTDCMAF